ncbi:hypothetical protein [Olivibacter sitiensis]|uniref:hypothetical protein n=1 Tax=Olivibacter sitiensis TaxID=376470 RepID=UPI000428E056|nr:hypothetical protein [Olivibacter sitiensis]
MLTSRARILVIAVLILLFAVALYQGTYQLAVIILGMIGYTVWSYYRDGTVFMASEAFKRKEFDKARILLSDIKKPEYLRKKRRNYYEYISGSLALQLLDYDKAEMHFQIASRLPFRRSNDKALVLVQLANINLHKKNYERVRAYVDKARELEVTSRVAQIINRIENEIPKQ